MFLYCAYLECSTADSGEGHVPDEEGSQLQPLASPFILWVQAEAGELLSVPQFFGWN